MARLIGGSRSADMDDACLGYADSCYGKSVRLGRRRHLAVLS
jgi:hypothetical protein